MKRSHIRKIIITAAAVILLAVVWQISKLVTSAEPLTEEGARTLIQEMYNGKILEVNKVNDSYQIKIQLDTGIYDVSINRTTREIGGITQRDSTRIIHEITEAEVKELVLQQQKGEIKRLEKKAEADQFFYYAIVQQGTNETSFKINASTGEIINTEMHEISQPDRSVQRITKENAINLALKRVKGKVDEVSIEQSNGLTFYLVEIDRENDQDATVQINAITGEIMSITWD